MKKFTILCTYIIYSIIIFITICLFSCSKNYNEEFAVGKNEQENKALEQNKRIKESFKQANKIINAKEQENIRQYIQRNQLKMTEHDGIYLQITNQGNGKNITSNNIITMQYSCNLLNGKKLNKNQYDTLTFNANNDIDIPFGLFIAVKYLKKNSVCKVIIPSNLSFTISNEGEKIANNNTLIYSIKIIEVK